MSSTWQYDTTANVWSQLSPPHWPSARRNGGAVYSAAHGGIVLFGGQDNSLTKFDDAWVYDSGDWQPLATPVRPAPRTDFGFAADSLQGNVVLYGGVFGNALDDTWLLTGSTWVQLQTSGPGPRTAPSMEFDPSRGLSILVGGAGLTDQAELTWEFDGNAWSSVNTLTLRTCGDPTRRPCGTQTGES